jgi:cytoskeletal protein RodZ
MERKIRTGILLLLAVCLIATGIICHRSIEKRKDAQAQVTRLESEVEELQAQASERAAKETETEEETVAETMTETESESQTETETATETESDTETEALPDESGESNG